LCSFFVGNRYGGGLLRAAVAAELCYYAEFLDAHCSEHIRAELFSAVGQFAQVAGFMAFDAYAHEDARRRYRFALNCAEEAEDWHLRAKVLACMSRQATWCGDPDQGVTFTELALVRSDRLTATERFMLHTDHSRALAKLSRVQDTVAAVGLADEELSHSRPANDPATVHYYDAAVHAGETGRALWDLAVHHGQLLAETRHRLSTAATAKGQEFVRGRVMDQIKSRASSVCRHQLCSRAVAGQHRLRPDLRSIRPSAQGAGCSAGALSARPRLRCQISTGAPTPVIIKPLTMSSRPLLRRSSISRFRAS
jgi:hypothetical protein